MVAYTYYCTHFQLIHQFSFVVIFMLLFSQPVAQNLPVRRSDLKNPRCTAAADPELFVVSRWTVVGEGSTLRWRAQEKDGAKKIHKQKGSERDEEVKFLLASK